MEFRKFIRFQRFTVYLWKKHIFLIAISNAERDAELCLIFTLLFSISSEKKEESIGIV